MNRHELREKAMITVYQSLLTGRDFDELALDTFEVEKTSDIDSYFLAVIHTTRDHKEEYAKYINQVLTDWRFERLGYIEQAILLNGCSEFELKQNSAAIIIDESVELAKKYCEPDASKLINRVLDII